MKKDYEPKTRDQALAHVVEEAGEMLAAAGKIQRFGWDSVNPELAPRCQETNARWLEREMRDLTLAISKFEMFRG